MASKRKPLSQLSVTDPDSIPNKKRKFSCSDKSTDQILQAGTLVRMVLRNFMCHSELVVTFNKNSTIIVGKNGSGKSAILTALLVGLGGKAALTERGTSIKAFVKAGQRSSSIEIVLNNSGFRAYKPEIFGEYIHVIRTISSTGTSSYRIKAENGKTIFTSVKQLQNITRHLNIQIDNPVCILNQDTARNFLSSNNPKHKFTLFLRATGLDTLAQDFANATANKNAGSEILQQKQKQFKKIQEELTQLKTKIDDHRKLSTLRKHKCALNAELVWSEVKELESELMELQETVQNQEKTVATLQENIDGRSEKLQSLSDKIKEVGVKINELTDCIKVQTEQQTDLKRKRNLLSDIMEKKQREKRELGYKVTSRTQNIEQLRSEISNITENKARIEQKKIDRINQLNYIKEKLKEQDEHLDTCKNDFFQLKHDILRREEQLQNVKAEINQLDSKILSENRRLSEIQSSSDNSLRIYGHNMVQIKEQIKKWRHKFVHEPRGPIGSYIKLHDKKWAVAIEGFLGPGFLRSFIVDNSKDALILKEIFKMCSQNSQQSNPSIITTKFIFSKHNVRSNIIHDAPSDCVCVYNAIEIDDPIVSNCIVDQNSIENVLLMPNDQRAIQLMSHRQNVPSNCRLGFTIEGHKYHPDPNYKTYSSRYHQAKFLQADKSGYIAQIKEGIQNHTEKKQNMSSELRRLTVELEQKNQDKRQLETKIENLKSAKSQLVSQVNAFKAEIEPESYNVDTMETDLNNCVKELDDLNESMKRVDEIIAETKVKVEENREKLQKVNEIINDLTNRLKNVQEEQNETKMKYEELKSTGEYDKNRLVHGKAKLRDAAECVKQKLRHIELQVKEAEKNGKRPQTIRKVNEIKAEIDNLERVIGNIDEAENMQELNEKYRNVSERLEQSKDILIQLHTNLNCLKEALQERERDYKVTEKICITLMQHSFKKILDLRQFEGDIEIDVKSKVLNLIVIPRSGSQTATNVTNLSGGERSLSTIAFLYSLWQCMNFPFYFLDEFDVYMDKLNRTKVIDVLLDQAMQRPQLQYVFLTPQDVSFITRDVDILRMQDPKRIEK